MAAVISGNGLGLFNSSLNQLGYGFGGGSRLGQGLSDQYVNIANGNLVLQNQDEQLLFRGMSIGQLRTYNSMGSFAQTGSDGWLTGFERRVELLSGTLNAAGSVMRLHTGDGSFQDFAYVSTNNYASTSGDGAHDTLTWASGPKTWTFVEGSTRRQELYADHANAVLKGRITRISDLKSDGTTPVGWDVLYDGSGRITQVRSRDASAGANPDGLVFGYDAAGRLTSLSTRENGVLRGQVAYEYDAAGRLSAVLVDLTPEDGIGDHETWNAGTAAENDGYLFRTAYTYADPTSLRIASVLHSDGTVASYTYDGSGRIATLTHGDTNTNDADGLGNTVTFSYDAPNLTTEVADAAGRTWSYRYDSAGQLVEVKAPAVDGLRDTSAYAYDGAGNLTSAQTSRGASVLARTDYAYDANGNLSWEWRSVDPNAGGAATAVSRTYTAANQLASETVYADLDPDGAGSAQTPTGGQTTQYVYDAQNRIRFVVVPTGEVQEVEYATSGSAIGQPIRERRYLGESYAGTVDLAALVAWATAARKADSALVESGYDAKGRLSQTKHYARVDANGAGIEDDQTEICNYVYDAQGLLRQKALLRSSTETANDGRDIQQTTAFAYDGMGRLLSETVTEKVGAAAATVLRSTVWSYQDSGNALRTIIEGGVADDGIADNDLLRIEVRNAAGQLITVTESALSGGTSHVSRNYYDASGLLRASEDAAGNRSYFFYDDAARLVGTVDEIGAVVVYQRDAAGRVTQTLAYATRVDTSAWLASGQVVPQDIGAVAPSAAADDRTTTAVYDGLGRLLSETDAEGGIVAYTYDGAGRLLQTRATDAAGTAATARTTRLFYDDTGRLAATLDAEGYLVEFGYDRAGRKVSETAYALATPEAQRASGTLAQLRPAADADDQQSRFFYDGRGNLTATLDPGGYLVEFVYDQARNQRASLAYATRLAGLSGTETLSTLRTQAQAGAVRETRRTFDAFGNVAVEVNHEGTVTRYGYDAQGRLLMAETRFGEEPWQVRENHRRYDAFGNLVGELSGEGAAHLHEVDDSQIDQVYEQYGIRHAYDALGQRTESIDAEGNKTWYFYDAAGQQTHVVRGMADAQGVRNAQAEVVETRYTAFGQVRDTTAFTGRITVAVPGSRDSAADAIEVLAYVAQIDSRVQFGYDRRGLATQSIDAEGFTTSVAYNAFGEATQRIAQIDAMRTAKATSEYDRRGLKTAETADADVLAQAFGWTYDAFGRAIAATDPNGVETQFAYDRLGRQVSVGRTVSGRLELSSMSYDAFGRTLTQTDAAGKVTAYAYDDGAKSFTVTTPEGVAMTTYHNEFGETVRVVDGFGSEWTYEYDLDGRQTVARDANDGYSEKIYDKRGLLSFEFDASGRAVGYEYDAAGRVLARIVDPRPSPEAPNDYLNLVTRYAYDGQGRQIEIVDPAGSRTTLAYDREGRLLESVRDADGLALRTTYAWDARGLQLSVTEGAGTGDAQTVVYAYDGLGRRISDTVAPGALDLTTTYGYDANGNLTHKTDPEGRVTRYTYDEAGRRIFAVDGAGGVTRTWYDVAGRSVATRAYAQKIDTSGLALATDAAAIQSLLTVDDTRDVQQYRVYDADGRVRLSIDGAGGLESRRYDALGRLSESVRYATTTVPLFFFKADLLAGTAQIDAIEDELVREGSAQDQMTWFVYDRVGRLIHTIDGQGAASSTSYDLAGRVVETTTYARYLDLLAERYAGTDPETGENVYKTIKQILREGRADDSVMSLLTSEIDWATTNSKAFIYDGAGRVAYTVQSATVTYDENGQNPQSARGAVHAFQYDDAGRVIAEIDYGNAVRLSGAETLQAFTAQPEWDIEGVESALRSTLGEEGGELEDIPQRITRYAYDSAGRQRFAVDAAGGITEQRFNAVGEVVESRSYGTLHPSATVTETALAALLQGSSDYRATTYDYDAAGRLHAKTDAYGHAETYEYDGAGLLVGYTNRDNHTWTYGYDAAGRRTLETSPQVVVTAVDASGNVTSSTRSILTRIAYDALGNVVARTEDADTASARTVQYVYDNRGHQVRTVFPDPGQIDANGQIVPAGTTSIEVTYDILGRAVVQQDVNGRYSYKIYDARGQVAYDIDPSGYATGHQYDGFGQEVLLTRFANPITPPVPGQPIALEQMEGDLLSPNDSKDRRIQTIYDNRGNKLEVRQGAWVDAEDGWGSERPGRVKYFDYNAYGELIREATLLDPFYYNDDYQDALGYGRWATSLYCYDDLGRRTFMAAPEGYVTTWSYTAQGEVGEQVEYARALEYNRHTLFETPPALPAPGDAGTGYDRVTRWQYDALGRKSSETAVRHYQDANGNGAVRDVVTAIGYDNEGHALTVTEDGQTTTTAYDALGRAISVEESERAMLRDDAAAQIQASASVGLANAGLYVQASPYSTMAYDAFGNVVQLRRYANGLRAGETAPTASAGDSIQLSRYDGQGRNVWEKDAAGTVYLKHYDAADNLLDVGYRLDGSDGRWAQVQMSSSYDASGRRLTNVVTRTEYAGSTVTGTGTDASERVVYNAFGEIVAKDSRQDAQIPVSEMAAQYEYDKLGNLVRSNAQGGIWRNYGYDMAGNQVREWHDTLIETTPGVAEQITAETRNETDLYGRIVKQILPSNSDDMQVNPTIEQKYDRWGNLIEVKDARNARTNYEYNELNQKVREIRPEVEIVDSDGSESTGRPVERWFYDALGRLVGSQDGNGNTRRYEYDAAGRLLLSRDATNAVTRAAYDGFGQQTLTQDALGYITFRDFDAAGRVVAQGDFLTNVAGTARTRAFREQYALNQNGDRVTVTDALGNSAKYDYDSNGKILRSRTAAGVVMSYAYDTQGNKIRETNALSDPSLIGGSGARASVFDSEDNETVYLNEQTWDYDYFGRLVDHNDLSGTDYDYAYDAATGQAIGQSNDWTAQGSHIDTPWQPGGTHEPPGSPPSQLPDDPDLPTPYGATGNRQFAYYANGQLKEIREATTAGTHWTRYTYDAAGNRNREESFSYDSTGLPQHLVARTTYDNHGRVTSVVQEDLVQKRQLLEVHYSYDAAGNRTRVLSRSVASDLPANPDFEEGDVGWDLGSGFVIEGGNGAQSGAYKAVNRAVGESRIVNQNRVLVQPGEAIYAQCYFHQGSADAGDNKGAVMLVWYDENGVEIDPPSIGNWVTSSKGGFKYTGVTGSAPPGARYVAVGAITQKTDDDAIRFDNFTWSYQPLIGGGPPVSDVEIPNPGFELSLQDWIAQGSSAASWSVSDGTSSDPLESEPSDGTYYARFGSSGLPQNEGTLNGTSFLVSEGETISASVDISPTETGSGSASGWIVIQWLDASGNEISVTNGNVVSATGNGWQNSSASGTAPAGAVRARILLKAETESVSGSSGQVGFDRVLVTRQTGQPSGAPAYNAPEEFKTYWFDYDAENRVTVVNGNLVNGQVVLGSADVSYALAYDAAGNAVQRRFLDGGDVMVETSVYDQRSQRTRIYEAQVQGGGGTPDVAESFDYDAVGRQTKHRTFDSGDLKHLDRTVFDADGRVLLQTAFGLSQDGTGYGQFPDGEGLALLSQADYRDSNGYGYDAAGRSKGYSFYAARREVGTDSGAPIGFAHFYAYQYEAREGYLEKQVYGYSTDSNFKASTSFSSYDAWGRRIAVREQTPGQSGINDKVRYFSYDMEGNILRRRDGTLVNGNFNQSSADAGRDQAYAYVNGQQIGSVRRNGEVDVIGRLTAYDSSEVGSVRVTVQAGDTLRSIAQRVYGNANLWYILAEANAIGDADLAAGASLNVPEVKVSTNDAGTFKPFNPAEAIGDTAPSLPYITPPPKHHCNALAQILMIVIVAVVAWYVAPFVAGIVGEGALATGISVAVGSAVAQGAGSVAGVTSFSWRQVAVDGITAGITAGASEWAKGINGLSNAAGELTAVGRAVQGVAGYGGSVIANTIVGRDTYFSWNAVAAAAVGGYLSGKLGGRIPTTQGGPAGTGNFGTDFASGLINGAANATARRLFGLGEQDWGQIATDAFGNAVGNAFKSYASSKRSQMPTDRMSSDAEVAPAALSDQEWAELHLRQLIRDEERAQGAPITPTLLDDILVQGANANLTADERRRLAESISYYTQLVDPYAIARNEGVPDIYGLTQSFWLPQPPEVKVEPLNDGWVNPQRVSYQPSTLETVLMQIEGGSSGVAKTIIDGAIGTFQLAVDFAGAGFNQFGLSNHEYHQQSSDRIGALVNGVVQFATSDGKIDKIVNAVDARFELANQLDAKGDIRGAAAVRAGVVYEVGTAVLGAGSLVNAGRKGLVSAMSRTAAFESSAQLTQTGILEVVPKVKQNWKFGADDLSGPQQLRLASTIGGDPIDAAMFARMKSAFERHGGVILQSEEVNGYLKWRGVEALTDNAKQMLLSTNPSKSAVFEEFIHTAQHRTGLVNELTLRYGNVEAERLLEIQAAEKLIRNRTPYGISNEATRQTIERLRRLRSQGGN